MTTDLLNFDKSLSDAHFVSFLFYYYCNHREIRESKHCAVYIFKADFEFWLHEAWLAGASLGFELGARMTIVGCHNSI